jgi:hypothetical protein
MLVAVDATEGRYIVLRFEVVDVERALAGECEHAFLSS